MLWSGSFSQHIKTDFRSMSSKTWAARTLDDDTFVEYFKTFLECSATHDQSSSKVVECIHDHGITDLKWLTVGCGFGNWESLIASKLQKAGCKTRIETIQAYEPNSTFFQILKNDVLKDNIWKCDAERIGLYQEAVTPDTVFPGRFNLITLSHVLYYFTDREERRRVIRNLTNYLMPGGMLIIVNLVRNFQGKENSLVAMLKQFMPRIQRDQASKHVDGGDYSLSTSDVLEELKPLLKESLEMSVILNIAPYVPVGREVALSNELLMNNLSFFLRCHVAELEPDAIQEIFQWVTQNFDFNPNGERCYTYAESVIKITKE